MAERTERVRRRPLPKNDPGLQQGDDPDVYVDYKSKARGSKKSGKDKEWHRGDRVTFTGRWLGEDEDFTGVITSIDGRYDNVLQDNIKVVRNARVMTDEGALVVIPVEELRAT